MTVGVSRAFGDTETTVTFTKGGAAWGAAPSSGSVHEHLGRGWSGASRVDDASAPAERLTAYTNIVGPASQTDPEDDDYLILGYWNLTSGTWETTPFYWGSMPYTGALPTANTVTYNGHAVGRYDGVDNNHHGYFAAAASLTADFGAKTLSGTIGGPNKFEIERTTPDTTTDLGHTSWSVTLNSLSLTDPSFTGGTTTGGGAWSGRFFGPAGSNPTGVAGVFNAGITGAGPMNDLKFDFNGSFAADPP